MASRGFVPAISIIIPMYNAEKYIAECLDSIHAQTFEDYEIIIVDDCSTDKSCEIVEKYISKFKKSSAGSSRLKLYRSEKNSGGRPGVPRNAAMHLARGEYLMFIDSDDAITKTALEEMYKIVEKNPVDVVHCEKFFLAQDEITTTDKKKYQASANLKSDFVKQPVLSEKVEDRIKDFIARKLDWSTWLNVIRRDFVLQNDLKFLETRVCVDTGFFVYIMTLAKTFLRVPNTFYIYRKRNDSVCRPALLSAEDRVKRWGSFFFSGLSTLDEFMSRQEVFQKNPKYRYEVLNLLMSFNAKPIRESYQKTPIGQMDQFVRRELADVEDLTALTAFLFHRMNVLNISILQQQLRIQQLQKKVSAPPKAEPPKKLPAEKSPAEELPPAETFSLEEKNAAPVEPAK